LTGATNGPFAANLSWQASTGTAAVTGYKVERCQGAGCSAFVVITTVTGTTFTDIGLTAATAYSYRVRATDTAGNVSDPSNTASITTAAASPPPPPAVLPAWASGLAIGQWTQIPNTALSSVDPSPVPPGNSGPASKIIAWTSLVVDIRNSKLYSIAGGGHADYAGNEVDMLDLEVDQPSWTQVLAPTPTGQLTNCASYYSDTRPAARHSYYGVILNEFEDRIMLLGGVFWCTSGGFHSAISSYNIGANTYSPPTAHPNMDTSLANGVAGIGRNPTNGDIYVAFNFNLGRWTRSTNTFALLSPSGSPAAGNGAGVAYDTTRNVIYFLGGAGATHVYTPTANSWTRVTVSGPNSADVLAANAHAMAYVAAMDSYLVRLGTAGGTVYQINAASFQATTFPTTNGTGVPGTVNGPYNKFLYVPRLNGAIYVPDYNGNAWFLRLH
jgi:chitodextrinase